MTVTIAVLALGMLIGVGIAPMAQRLPKARVWLIGLGAVALLAILFAYLPLPSLRLSPPRGAPEGGAIDEAEEHASRVLYLVEMLRTGNRDDDTDRLVRATLSRDGKLTTETVLSAKARFFGDPTQARVVDGRYIVTQHGGVVDAQEGRIINDETRGYLLGAEQGQVVYHLYDPSSSLEVIHAPGRAEQFGVFAFDLEKRVRLRPEARHWYLEGTKSPDRSKAVAQSYWGILYLNRLDGPQTELAPGRRIKRSRYAGDFETRVPCLWLDNDRILTQEANGKLVTLDTQGRVEAVCTIAGLPDVLDGPRLSFDPKGRIIYACGRAEYVINVERKTAALLEEYALGHGFETTVETGTRGLRPIFFKGQMIGSGLFAPSEVRTAPGVIAKRDLGDNGSRRSVYLLWTKLGFGWRSFDLDYGGIIGWAN